MMGAGKTPSLGFSSACPCLCSAIFLNSYHKVSLKERKCRVGMGERKQAGTGVRVK